MNNIFEYVGGRRFVTTMVCVFAAWWLCNNGKMTGETCAAIIIATAAVYIRYNTVQKSNEAANESSN